MAGPDPGPDPDTDAVPYVDEAGFIWCNRPLSIDEDGAPATRCRRQLWTLIEQTSGSGHALPCTDGPGAESLDDVDLGDFNVGGGG